MNAHSDTTPARTSGPLPAAENLARTLDEEHDTVARLADLLQAHDEALQAHRRDLIEEATHQTNDLVGALARIRQTRERQMRLLGRLLQIEIGPGALGDLAEALRVHPGGNAVADRLVALRDAIGSYAGRARDRCRDLEFSIQYAIDLDREILQALQGIDSASTTTRTYTPQGAATPSGSPRSFLNTIG